MEKDLKEEIAGKWENIKGRVKEAVGVVKGDKRAEAEGAAERVAGAGKEKAAEVKRDLTDPDRRQDEEADDE